MGEPDDIKSYPVKDNTPLRQQKSMLLYPTASRESPINTEYSKLDLQFLQDPFSHSKSQMTSYTLGESSFQMSEEPPKHLKKKQDIAQSHIVPPGISNQSSFQRYPVPVNQFSYPRSQSPPFPTGTSMQASHQWPPGPTSKLSQQMSQSPLLTTETLMQSSLQRHPVCESKLSHQVFQSSLVPTGTSMESSFQCHLVHTSKLSQQMSHGFVHPVGNPTQSSLQTHQIPASQQHCQISQSPLAAEATSTQSNPQCHPYFKRYLGTQMSPGLSTIRSPCEFPDHLMNAGPLTSRTHPVNPRPQLPSGSSGSYVFDDSLDSLESLDRDHEVPPSSPKKQKKIRTVYSKKHKLLLQDFFMKCKNPSMEDRMKLANEIGVTPDHIQVWFKNRRAKDKRKNSQNASEVPETGEGSKAVSESTSYNGHLSVFSSANEESIFPAYHDQPERNDATPDPEVASDQLTTPIVAGSQEPENSQYSSPSTEDLWKRVLEDLEASEDW